MNRADLQVISNTRIREARVLLKAGEYSGAYYLAGYAVECAIKACFAKKVHRYDFPDKDTKKLFTHNLSDLMNFAGLNVDLAAATKSDSNLNASWLFVKKLDGGEPLSYLDSK